MLSWIAALVAAVILYKQGATNMGIGEDIAAKVAELGGKLDTMIERVNALLAAGTISPEAAAAILADIQKDEDKIDAVAAPTP